MPQREPEAGAPGAARTLDAVESEPESHRSPPCVSQQPFTLRQGRVGRPGYALYPHQSSSGAAPAPATAVDACRKGTVVPDGAGAHQSAGKILVDDVCGVLGSEDAFHDSLDTGYDLLQDQLSWPNPDIVGLIWYDDLSPHLPFPFVEL